MAIPQTGNTQAERLGEQLIKLRPDVTAQDRKDAVAEFGFTTATISRYLNGSVLDNDTAANLISFFNSKIENREKVIPANAN